MTGWLKLLLNLHNINLIYSKMEIDYSITTGVLINGGTAYSAQRNNSTEPKFVIGGKIRHGGNYSIFKTNVSAQQLYKPEDYTASVPFHQSNRYGRKQ
jgi:hypothetical protein